MKKSTDPIVLELAEDLRPGSTRPRGWLALGTGLFPLLDAIAREYSRRGGTRNEFAAARAVFTELTGKTISGSRKRLKIT